MNPKRVSPEREPSKQPKGLSSNTLSLVAERFKILGDPLRLQILQVLQNDEWSVGQIVDAIGASQANISRHLQILLRARIVERRKEGLHVFYRISDTTVLDLCSVVCDSLAERLSRELSAFGPRESAAAPGARDTRDTRKAPDSGD